MGAIDPSRFLSQAEQGSPVASSSQPLLVAAGEGKGSSMWHPTHYFQKYALSPGSLQPPPGLGSSKPCLILELFLPKVHLHSLWIWFILNSPMTPWLARWKREWDCPICSVNSTFVFLRRTLRYYFKHHIVKRLSWKSLNCEL